MMGAVTFMSYDMMLHYFRHHDEVNGRPRYYDHAAATTILATVYSLLYLSHPYQILGTMFLSVSMVGPVSWWFKTQAGINQSRHANIFYENTCSSEEIERFRQQDMVENLAFTMMAQKGYGYIHLPDAKSS